jgi:hypothetical protein
MIGGGLYLELTPAKRCHRVVLHRRRRKRYILVYSRSRERVAVDDQLPRRNYATIRDIRGSFMDRREEHQQHKEKEREQKKKEEKIFEEVSEKNRLPIHPAWVVVIGVALVGTVVYVWTFWWR